MRAGQAGASCLGDWQDGATHPTRLGVGDRDPSLVHTLTDEGVCALSNSSVRTLADRSAPHHLQPDMSGVRLEASI